jgi:hypothetical protein
MLKDYKSAYEDTTHLIDSEGQPTIRVRAENVPSRKRLLVAGLAAVTLAATGTVFGVRAVEPGTASGPDVAPLVHAINNKENDPDPIQNPVPVSPEEAKQAVSTSNGPQS